MSLVLDNSVAMRWCFGDGSQADLAYADAVMDTLLAASAIVPAIWGLEVANVLARAERQRTITAEHMSEFIARLAALDIETDVETSRRALGATLYLARQHGLSAYDAAYLELALRRRLPLATLDVDLRQAAADAGCTVVAPPS